MTLLTALLLPVLKRKAKDKKKYGVPGMLHEHHGPLGVHGARRSPRSTGNTRMRASVPKAPMAREV